MKFTLGEGSGGGVALNPVAHEVWSTEFYGTENVGNQGPSLTDPKLSHAVG